MRKEQVVVLGLNGHLGQAVAMAFVAAGWEVTGMARADRHQLPGVRFIRGDAGSIEDMKRAIGDARVVVNALNLPYADWYEGRKEALMARVVEAMGRDGRTVLFPGNIYNYNARDRYLTPGLAQVPQTERGAIRVRVEEMFANAAARGDIQLITIRAGDFYGPASTSDWFDLVMLRQFAKGRIETMGLPGVGHSWAYLPDLGRAVEALAAMRRSLGPSENFHFAGHFVTGEEMGAAIRRAAGRTLDVRPFPLWFLRLAGLFDRTMREVSKMDYIWRHPIELRDGRLPDLLGPGFGTPFAEAVAATIAPARARPVRTAAMQLPEGEAV